MTKEELSQYKADAVMEFINMTIGAFESGFVDTHQITLSQLYRVGQNYIKDNYDVDSPMIEDVWGVETATSCMVGDILRSDLQ